jgi:hypothetical protein
MMIPAPASATMNAIRSSGYVGSSGRYAAPDFNTPRSETISSAVRGRRTPTTVSGPTPSRRRRSASSEALAWSSR